MPSTGLDIRFLENLKQRLSVSNRRSIYLNALAGRYLTRLDLSDLELIETGLAKQFLQELLSNPKSSTHIRVSPEKLGQPEIQRLMRRLSSMLIEHRDHYNEHGVETFGFGFPILLRRDTQDPTRIIKAPMFIWQLSIERNWRKANEWVLKRDEDYSIVSNISLASHLLNDAGLQLSPIYDHLMDDGILDKDELAGLLQQQFSQLLFEPQNELLTEFRNHLDGEITPILSPDEIKELTLEQPKILWSGIFGLFRSQKESIAKDIEHFISHFNPLQQSLQKLEAARQPGHSSFMKHTFAIVDTDPSQQHLLHALGRGENLIIQGPPGTGKSQTLTGIITNVLSNGGRCLVVCEKKTALDVLYNNLKQLGLEELAVIVEDVYRDRSTLVSSVRERTQQQHPKYSPSPNFIRLLQSCAMQVGRLQKYHEKLITPICGNERWSDVVPRCMQMQTKYPKERVEQFLKAKDFKFQPDELEFILRRLREGEPLFKELGTLQHPFNAFHERFFQIANTFQVGDELNKSVDGLLYAVDGAQRDLLTQLYQYEKMLEDHYTNVMAKKANLIDEIVDMIEDGLKASKYYFNKNGGFYRNFLTGISKKFKTLKDEKLVVLKNYTLLRNLHERYEYFDHRFIDLSDMKKLTFEQVKKDAQKYRDALSNWYSQKESAIREFVNQLSNDYVHPHVDFKKQVREITRNLDLFAQNFMKSQVFKVPFGFKSFVIRERLNNLEELDENLKKLAANFEADFALYHPLKYFWLNLTPTEQSAFQGMATSNIDNWEDYFTSWYLHHLLNAYADENVPQETHYRGILRNFKREESDMRKGLLAHTLNYWRAKQSMAVADFNKQKAPLKVHGIYNLRGNTGGRRTPLRQIFEADPLLFTTFYPVLMVNPSVCASMLPLQPHLFDLVIFDEASQLRLEDTFGALMRGNYKVVSGDSQQMPPSDYFQGARTLIHNEDVLTEEDAELDIQTLEFQNEAIDYLSSSESLLEYTIADGNYKEEFLQVHYRSKHPYLIDFSNAAFYGRRLTPMPPSTDYIPIKFNAVDGIYEERTNKMEAEQVIARLLEIVKLARDTQTEVPSVGVATFNLTQRNYILELVQTRSLADSSVGADFEQLFAAGLFIKNLENIQGDERDYLIISTTFGKKADGNFLQNFGPLNRQQGYRLLNVIITRAKQQLEVFTSIPPEYYGQYRQLIAGEGNNGKAILYAYLAYAKAVSEGDAIMRDAILKLVYEHCSQKPLHQIQMPNSDLHSFKQLVFDTLQQALPGVMMEQNAVYSGFSIPVLIYNQDKQPKVALYFDVFHEFYSEEAYAWDMFYETHLEKMGFAVGRVWSYSWWQNTKAEQQRILEFLKENM